MRRLLCQEPGSFEYTAQTRKKDGLYLLQMQRKKKMCIFCHSSCFESSGPLLYRGQLAIKHQRIPRRDGKTNSVHTRMPCLALNSSHVLGTKQPINCTTVQPTERYRQVCHPWFQPFRCTSFFLSFIIFPSHLFITYSLFISNPSSVLFFCIHSSHIHTQR